MGTWRIIAYCDDILVDDFVADGGSVTFFSGPTDKNATLSYIVPVGDFIYLDGAAIPVSFIELPLGFLPDSSYIYSPNAFVDRVSGPPSGWSNIQIVWTELGINQSCPGNGENLSKIGMTVLELFGLEGSSVSHVCHMPADPGGTTLRIDGNVAPLFLPLQSAIYIDGTYVLFNHTWTISTPTTPVKVGDRITIASDPASAADLSDVDEVTFTIPSTFICGDGQVATKEITVFKDGTCKIVNVCIDGTPDPEFITQESSGWIITWTFNLIIITIPYGFGDYEGPVPVVVGVNPPTPTTRFSGSVPVGTLDMVFADASGIYNITPSKLNDTLYDRDGDTTDVAIPKPYFRTGFVDG